MDDGFEVCNLYEVLELSMEADDDDIRKSYLRLSLRVPLREDGAPVNYMKQCHPDKTSDPDAGARFHALRLAYETLRDGEARRSYDTKLRGKSMIVLVSFQFLFSEQLRWRDRSELVPIETLDVAGF